MLAAKRIMAHPRRSHVVMLDLLPSVPYYTGHLCVALQAIDRVKLTLGFTTYTHDRTFFSRMGLRNARGLLDVAGRFAGSIKAVRRCLKLFECVTNLSSLAFRFWRKAPEIVHVQFIPLVDYGLPIELWFMKIARMLGVRVVYTVHNVLPHDSGERLRETYARIYKLIDGFICHDEHAKAKLASEFGIKPSCIWVIPHGPIFEEEAKPAPRLARAQLGLPGSATVILWQGIVRPYKGVLFLLRAWKKTFQKIEESVEAVDHFQPIRMARKERRIISQGGFQQALVRFTELRVAGGFRQVPPRHGGLELVAPRRLRPAESVALQRFLAG